MRTAYLSLGLIACLLSLVPLLAPKAAINPQITSQLQELATEANSETKLALGLRLALSQVDIYELELVSGIGDSVAQGIVREKNIIAHEARGLATSNQARAFERVKGVGPKLSSALVLLVDPEH